MKAWIAFLLIVTVSAESLRPKFSWLSDRSDDGIPLLSIQLKDRDDDEGDDVIVLSRYNPIPVDLDEFRSEVDPCIFKGFFRSDPSSEVVVTGGCPGNHTFDISINSRQMEGLSFEVKNGIGETNRTPLGTAVRRSDGSETYFRDRAVPSGLFKKTKEMTDLSRASLPSAGFNFPIAIIYDISWLALYGTQAEAVNAVRRVVAQAQIVFNWPSLTVPITLNVVSIAFQNVNIPADDTGLDALAPFATSSAIQSYVGLTNSGKYGGIAYQPGICGTLRYRTAVIRTGSWGDVRTGQIIAHELGHNLGMSHNFIDPYTSPKNIRRDSAGNTCTNVNGVMDYYVTVQKWSTCSVQALTSYYNYLLSRGGYCLATNTKVDGNWGSWTAYGTCSLTCGGGTQSRTRLCNSPAPSNGGATCVGDSSQSQQCNNQSCTPVPGNWSDWGAWGTCNATCGGGTQSRARLCNNPAPSSGGADCVGSSTSSQACNTQACTPINGTWGDWSAWGTCSVTCGGGNQSRSRVCNNPAPAFGGANCSGLLSGSQTCNTQNCTTGTPFDLCQDTVTRFICKDSTKRLNVISAFYGRTDLTTCPIQPILTTACFWDWTAYIKSLCQGQYSCVLESSNYRGNPCPGTTKYLHVEFGACT